MYKTLESFVDNNTIITLYHGTTKYCADNMVENGWKPLKYSSGSNQGNPNYLYLTSEPENALWYAENNNGNTIVEVKDIPLSFLRPDPEDEAGYTMSELIERMNHSMMPANFILTKELDKKHFKIK